MAKDVVPELMELIRKEYSERVGKNVAIRDIEKLIEENSAKLEDALRYSTELGKELSKALLDNLTEEKLPDGKLYYNIADRTAGELLRENYRIVNDKAKTIQNAIDEKNGIGLSSVDGEDPEERIHNLVSRAANAETLEEAQSWLGEPVINCTESFYDSFVESNAKFSYESGMKAKIIRTAEADCCEWCSSLAGSYDYGELPAGAEIFHRHKFCRCTVTYERGRERQNVWSKKRWTDGGRQESGSKALTRAPKADKLSAEDRQERFAQFLINDPKQFGYYTPESLKEAFENAGFEVYPLGKGKYKGVSFENGGGYRVNFGDGGLIQYHPAKGSHHGEAYYKVSTGKGGIHHYDRNGKEKE